ncbi:uncharacterized protein EKO05_0005312 [Ascochyta rabiei]|uniref:uncharacterized protein n=1 Tax=Didymella rabiei TaxID=5454 RepID=UPI0021FD53A5|nr:uncharacterized protein EKO05_0005312 [Ascochyta rabiei]UPX14841.1 hypothetical protein EKO05_0005312 [Ascochyta rabiei]
METEERVWRGCICWPWSYLMCVCLPSYIGSERSTYSCVFLFDFFFFLPHPLQSLIAIDVRACSHSIPTTQSLVTQSERPRYLGSIPSTALLGVIFERWDIYRTADWWNLRHHLSAWLSGRGVGGCYVVHSQRIFFFLFFFFFFFIFFSVFVLFIKLVGRFLHCHSAAKSCCLLCCDFPYPLLVEEAFFFTRCAASLFVACSGGWIWT